MYAVACIGSDEVFVLSDSEDESANRVGGLVGSIPLARGQAQRDRAMPDPSYVVQYGAVSEPIPTRTEEEALRSGQYFCQAVSRDLNSGNVRYIDFLSVQIMLTMREIKGLKSLLDSRRGLAGGVSVGSRPGGRDEEIAAPVRLRK